MFFFIGADPIVPSDLEARLRDDTAGALVTFEGRVRNVNEARNVQKLEYEAATDLARNEFARIAEETLERFDIIQVSCAHRYGILAIGDIAVWIGILAGHRGPAFDACRYLIDELKKRLPIWKKEYYRDGDSGWINHP